MPTRPHRRLRALVVAIACLLAAPGAHAYVYPVPLDGVETEEDLNELYFDGELDDDEYERLLAILREPVDLNSADADELYDLPGLTYELVEAILADRDANGFYEWTGDLGRIPVMPTDVLEELRPFAEARKPLELRDYVSSTLELKVGWTLSDPGVDSLTESSNAGAPPSAYLKSRTEMMRWLTLGFAVTEGQEAAELDYQPRLPVFATSGSSIGEVTNERSGYLSDGLATHWDLAKIFVHTPRGRKVQWSAIAGSYRIGFGMGTVFDSTSREYPKGWVPDMEIDRSEAVSSSAPARYRDRPGQFGAAASLHRLDLDPLWLSGHVFFSRIDRNSYQRLQNDVQREDFTSDSAYSEAQGLYICERAPDSGECEYRTDPATGDRIYKLSTITLLDAFRETTVGGNANVHFGPRTQLGFTGYWSWVTMLLDPESGLRFSRSAKYPADHAGFGAFGGHAFWGVTDEVTLRGEGALTDQGGSAVWLRGFLVRRPFEAELGLRRYDEDYENPWTSPYAEPDMLDGLRARDELGVNWRLGYRLGTQVRLRLRGDVWQREYAQCTLVDIDDGEERDSDEGCLSVSDETLAKKSLVNESVVNMTHEATATYRPHERVRLTLRPGWTDHDISKGGRDETYDGGAGMKLSVYGKVDVTPTRWLRVSAAYRHAWVDDDGPRNVFKPSLYADHKAEDRAGRTVSTKVVDDTNPDCFDGDGDPLYMPPSSCASLYDGKFRQDRYYYLELVGKFAKTTGAARFKVFEEAIGYDSVVGSAGSYWQLSLKVSQQQVFDLVAGALRYDLLKYTDDRVKWYQEDLRPDRTGTLLLDRYNHQLTATVKLQF